MYGIYLYIKAARACVGVALSSIYQILIAAPVLMVHSIDIDIQ